MINDQCLFLQPMLSASILNYRVFFFKFWTWMIVLITENAIFAFYFFEVLWALSCLKSWQLKVIRLIIHFSGWIPSKQISMLRVSYPEPKGSWREHLSAQLPTLHHALACRQRDFHPKRRRFWSFFFAMVLYFWCSKFENDEFESNKFILGIYG